MAASLNLFSSLFSFLAVDCLAGVSVFLEVSQGCVTT